MKDNILFKDKILWYDINENGYIKGNLIYKPAVYIYKGRYNEEPCYVGSSVRLNNRISSHRSRINNWNKNYYNNNGSLMFYNSVLKYGWNNFQFGILEYIDTLITYEHNDSTKDVLLKREQYYLDSINPSLNTSMIAGSPLGVKHSITFSKNLSAARRGKKNKATFKINNISKVISPETRLKLSCRSTGISVKLFDQSNNLINQFPSMTSAAKYLGVSDRTIGRILNTGVSYDNFIYEFEVIYKQPIIVIDKENNIIKEYCSLRAIAKDINISRSVLSNYINTNKLLKNKYLISRDNIR